MARDLAGHERAVDLVAALDRGVDQRLEREPALASPQVPEVLRGVTPRYPAVVASLGQAVPARVICSAELTVDPWGLVEAVRVEGCPSLFARVAGEAALQWQFYQAATEPQAVRFRLGFEFLKP